MADIEIPAQKPTLTDPTAGDTHVTSPTDTEANVSGSVGDNATKQEYPFDPNGPGTAVGVPQRDSQDGRGPLRDMPVDANGELSDYDEETPARVTVPELADEGESFSNLPEVTGEDALAGNSSAAPAKRGVAPDDDIGLELMGDSQSGTGGIMDDFKEEMRSEGL